MAGVRERESLHANPVFGLSTASTIVGVRELVGLVQRYRPFDAERARRLLAGPEPDLVSVFGPEVAAVGRLASALAARLPYRVARLPWGSAPPGHLVEQSRAVVWVCCPPVPAVGQHWAQLGELAGVIDDIHLVEVRFAGCSSGGTPPGFGGLAAAVPRLADAPVIGLLDRELVDYGLADGELVGGGSVGGGLAAGTSVDGFGELVAELAGPGPAARAGVGGELATVAERNAARLMHTSLAEFVVGRETRRESTALYQAAVRRSVRERREQITMCRLAVVAERPRWVRAELARVRLRVAADTADGLRGLREQIRDQLEGLDRAGRADFPRRVAGAATRFTGQVARRLDDEISAVEGAVRREAGDWLTQRHSATRPVVIPPATVPSLPIRRRWEDGLLVAVGISGGLGLSRVLLTGGGVIPVPVGAWSVPVAVGVGVGAAYWLVRGRRAMADRAALARWASELLSDVRGRLDSMLAERILDAERRLGALVDRVVAARAAELDSRSHDQEAASRLLAARLAKRAEAEASALTELRVGCTQLAELLGRVSAAGGAAVS